MTSLGHIQQAEILFDGRKIQVENTFDRAKW
jgi:hypothetical protein